MDNTEQKLRKMLEIQNDLNKVVNPDWKTQGYRWEDAISVETVELFNHLNWKWWKKYTKEPDYEQVKLEAIDIWHFILSRMLQHYGIDKAATILESYFCEHDQDVESQIDWEEVKDCSRELLEDVTRNRSYMLGTAPLYVGSFVNLLAVLGITINELYITYVAKVELNRLRWANGYGTTYIKTWDGQEDNVWLAEYVKTLDSNASDFAEQIRTGLAFKYAGIRNAVYGDPKK